MKPEKGVDKPVSARRGFLMGAGLAGAAGAAVVATGGGAARVPASDTGPSLWQARRHRLNRRKLGGWTDFFLSCRL